MTPVRPNPERYRCVISAKDDRDEMFRLYEKHYDAAERGRFEYDLSEKDAVVVIRRQHAIIGFSTFFVGRQAVDGATVHYLFLGRYRSGFL